MNLHLGQLARFDLNSHLGPVQLPCLCELTMKGKLSLPAAPSAGFHCLFARRVSSRLSVPRVSIFGEFPDSMGTNSREGKHGGKRLKHLETLSLWGNGCQLARLYRKRQKFVLVKARNVADFFFFFFPSMPHDTLNR